jgi:hypothetical protein
MATGIPQKVFTIDKGLQNTWAMQFVVASGAAATIVTGTPAKTTASDGSVVGAVVPMVDADGTVTAMRFAGIAKTTSTDTSSVAGTVDTWAPVPGIIYRGSPKVAGSANTQAKINALASTKVIFDLTSGNWTVDSGATDALINCVVICGGVPNNDEFLFYYSPKGTVFDTSTAI